jgi:predicted PurR-regulated permease PerM
MTEPKPAGPPPLHLDLPETGPSDLFARRLNVAAMSLLVFVLIVYLLREFASILQPLFIAVFIAYLVLPLHNWVVRKGVSSLVAYLALANFALLGLFVTAQLILNSFREFRTRLPEYQSHIGDVAGRVSRQLPGGESGPLHEALMDTTRLTETLFGMGQSAIGGLISSLSVLFVVAVYFMFLLAESAGFEPRIRRSLTPSRADEVMAVIRTINGSISEYIVVKTFVSALTGIMTSVVLVLFGVEFPVMWGVLTFFANYVPYVGSLSAVLLPVGLDVLANGELGHAVFLLVSLTAVQQLVGLAIEPLLAGSRLNLSPLVIILSVSFWGVVWGVPGMILAVPLVVIIKTVLENIAETRFIALFLAKR